MDDTPLRKHFLDTSVVRPMLLGPRKYKKYLASQFADHLCYISPYILMEFRRSFINNVIDFYFTLRNPFIETIDDAISLWSHNFKGSEIKAVLELTAQLFKTNDLKINRPQDKPRALQRLGLLIKRLDIEFREQVIDIGQDATRCERAKVPFSIEVKNIAEGFTQFLDAFDDVENCRSKCRIDDFILDRYRDEVDGYLKQVQGLSKNDQNRGFRSIIENLEEIVEKGAKACSCKRCERIGDAVIALNAPRTMQLEHTDQSFDYLCPPIQQPHKKHPSIKKILESD